MQPLIGDTSGGTSQVIFFNPADGLVLGENAQDGDVPTIGATTDAGATWRSTVPTT
ncbi:MAG TPA: hypothetical protein VL961_05430 [Acidimicrobiales bacterium]|nr:hypothetical protein [Acidimicrobiales bacterium]